MKSLTSTEAKRRFARTLKDACDRIVLINRRGKRSVAMMPAEEARIGILSMYALGRMSRAVAMERLGFDWYGQLVDAMAEANLRVQIPPDVHQAMVDDLVKLLGG